MPLALVIVAPQFCKRQPWCFVANAAIRHLEQGQKLDPSYAGTFMDMGQLLMQEGQPAKALSM